MMLLSNAKCSRAEAYTLLDYRTHTHGKCQIFKILKLFTARKSSTIVLKTVKISLSKLA